MPLTPHRKATGSRDERQSLYQSVEQPLFLAFEIIIYFIDLYKLKLVKKDRRFFILLTYCIKN